MTRIISLLITLTTCLAAQPNSPIVEGILSGSGKGVQPIRAFVFDADRVIPQIATGGDGQSGFFMIFEVFNITERQVDVTIFFADQQGGTMMLPLAPSGELAGGFRVAVPPGGVAFTRTMPTGPMRIGYALVDAPADASGFGLSVGVNAIFNQVVPGRPVFQAGIPVSTPLHDRFFVPYLNTGGFTGTLAIVNVIIPQRVTFIARDTAGMELCRTSRLMGQGEHAAFIIREQLSCAANRDGLLEVRADQPSLSGIGFLAQDDGAFVSQTVFGVLRATP
jgi:hypothetical protein